VPAAFDDPDHPCHAVVRAQAGANDVSSLHVPEPWSGDLIGAKLLFIGSNPSLDAKEDFPQRDDSDERMRSFFVDRFQNEIERGVRPKRTVDGEQKRDVRYLVEVLAMARDIYGRDDIEPGRDYALTEVVHCKSLEKVGVDRALTSCVDRWLRRILDASGATVVVALGKAPRLGISRALGVEAEEAQMVVGDRRYLFVGAPNSSDQRNFARCFPDVDVRGAIRSALD
jgi:hypothetical protein